MKVLYSTNMSAKPVQISLDSALIERIDADPETRSKGRSAFVRAAVERYLAAKARRAIDARIRAAYDRQADAHLAETADLIGSQAWPDD
jgi:metal-responsive CopG/Arc/MetJ family transcriptional regulator